jgi:hypothetical protein
MRSGWSWQGKSIVGANIIIGEEGIDTAESLDSEGIFKGDPVESLRSLVDLQTAICEGPAGSFSFHAVDAERIWPQSQLASNPP